ncbi:TetR/AcrR family transcriptional regulator [Streptomyces sp. NPDC057011]|uniref:TetR/AcrR family transcriptional regulator n=1 Tax=unclassified Streptomyces TaxID=2593676 RepID=UPI0036417FD6
MSGSDTYQRILTSALGCFLENGVRRTTVEQVRERAGVSNGSFFHHFRTKQDLAEAVYLHGLEEHQAGLLAVLTPEAGLQDGIEGAVRRHLAWVEAHPELAAFLVAPPDWGTPRDAPRIAACSREFFGAVGRWLEDRGWDGAPELGVVIAVWIGPAQEYTRTRLVGGSGGPRTSAVATPLARAAWNALRPLLSASPQEDTA